MGKRGPCFHCGIESTPLWRNGPSEKPVLCNACGSRYRLRGTLVNYTPKHLQAFNPLKKKNMNKIKKNQSKAIMNKTFRNEEENVSNDVVDCTASKCYEESSRGLTSSESITMSYPESETYFQIKQEDGSLQSPGEIPSRLWDVHIPSRKRSLVEYRSLSAIERLQRDLYKILRHQDPFISSESQEGMLIYTVNNQIAPSEIGLGSVLLKHSAVAPTDR